MPVPARDGSWVVGGWAASRYEPETVTCRDLEVTLAAGRVLHAQLAAAVRSRPPGLDARDDQWSRAEALAFGPGHAMLAAAAGTPAAGAVRRVEPHLTDVLLGPDQLVHADLAGNVLLVHETINQVKEPRRAWLYNSGQRRVRRAPNVAYDGPGTAADGQRTSDNLDLYNGAPDRYNWELKGKKELYIPYNSYRLTDESLSYDDIIKPGHVDQGLTRYELHRVWHVTATLKDGERHVYGKRDFYIDEDTWQIAAVDHYDGRGNLWRVAEAHAMQIYDANIPAYAFETLYDLLSGRYLVMGLTNEEDEPYQYGTERRSREYTPAALRRDGVR